MTKNSNDIPTIFFELKHTYFNPNINTGIQRVVRKLAIQGYRNQQAQPVVRWLDRHWNISSMLETFQGFPEFRIERKLLDRSLQLYKRCQHLRSTLVHSTTRFASLSGRLLSAALFIWKQCIDLIATSFLTAKLIRYGHIVSASNRDILVISEIEKSVPDRFSGRIVSIVYDTIPESHPEFFDPPLVDYVLATHKQHAQIAWGNLCISNFTANEYKSIYKTNGWVESFKLGCDVLENELHGKHTNRIRDSIYNFEKRRPYLFVGTLEPRKNVTYLIDALEKAVEKRAEINLVIVGAIGWRCEALIQRINSHPLLGKNLFVFHDVNDGELDFLYRCCSALVFPSKVEGFGLPLVEALQRKRLCFVSDIPVFREIAGNNSNVSYFPLDESHFLTDLLVEDISRAKAPEEPQPFNWPSWQESAADFFSRIQAHVKADTFMTSPLTEA